MKGYSSHMDIISMAFYAVVCGLLSAAAPALPSALPRLAIGAAVGIAAAAILPLVRGMMGY